MKELMLTRDTQIVAHVLWPNMMSFISVDGNPLTPLCPGRSSVNNLQKCLKIKHAERK